MNTRRWMRYVLGGLFGLTMVLVGCGGGSGTAEDGQSAELRATLVYYAMPG